MGYVRVGFSPDYRECPPASPIFSVCEVASNVITVVGATTCLFAATVGLAQNDIKRVVAYSTCSQLGYMFFAAGLGGYGAAMFHLFTHAFFKALLFLGAGSVIHGMHHEQDMRFMGGVRKPMMFTWVMMLIGTLALIELRVGIGALTELLIKDKVAIIGLGGTGSYILDLIAKTPVAEIRIFDADEFLQHNAFRAPSAASLDDLKHGARVGTSSPRRAAQLQRARPDVRIVPLRGNVATRLAHIENGDADATLLAAAGLERLDMGNVGAPLPLSQFLPAASQGAVGIDRLTSRKELVPFLAAINDVDTFVAVQAERALLEALGGKNALLARHIPLRRPRRLFSAARGPAAPQRCPPAPAASGSC